MTQNKPSNQKMDAALVERAQRFDQAGEKAKAARFYRMAGEAALVHFANEDALDHFQAALERTPGPQLAIRYDLILAIEQIYALNGQTEARCDSLTTLAALADALDSDQQRADVASRLALFKLDKGEHGDAISIARLAVRMAQLAGAVAAEVDLNLVWGRALLRQANYTAAQGKLQRALRLAQHHNLRSQEADSLRYLGVLNEENKRFDDTKTFYTKALTLYEQLNDCRGSANVLTNLGKVAFEQGEYSSALHYWNQVKPKYLAIGDKSGLCRILINQSAICLDLGIYGEAQVYSQEALSLSREIGLRFGEALALINSALAEQYQDNPDSAFLTATQALSLAVEMGSKRLEGYAYNTLGRVMMTMNKPAEAAESYWEALAIWHELKQEELIVEAEAGLIDVALGQDDIANAQLHLSSILPRALAGDPFEGTESPFRIYWLCYQVLKSAKDPQAASVLQAAHRLLLGRANKIEEISARETYLERVTIHQLIMAETAECTA